MSMRGTWGKGAVVNSIKNAHFPTLKTQQVSAHSSFLFSSLLWLTPLGQMRALVVTADCIIGDIIACAHWHGIIFLQQCCRPFVPWALLYMWTWACMCVNGNVLSMQSIKHEEEQNYVENIYIYISSLSYSLCCSPTIIFLSGVQNGASGGNLWISDLCFLVSDPSWTWVCQPHPVHHWTGKDLNLEV